MAIFISGNLVDIVGMRRLHILSALGFITGVALIILAPHPDRPVASLFDHVGTTFLYVGFFMFGLSHGLVEGVINPLMASLYTDEKTRRITAVHAWWPAGLIIGGLLAIAMSNLGVAWQLKLCLILVPALTYLVMALSLRYPKTERAMSNVSTRVAGGEYATRGFIDAYDAATGRRVWRFYTIPGPGEPGNETWKGESWKTGGAAAWLTGTYDPDLHTIYWPVGNPAPQFDRAVRGELDNLYSDSVVALNPDTGTLRWHFQFTPNDGHDWDSVQDMVLVDRVWRGQKRKLLLHADRNGHFYVLDRTNGAFLSGTPFVYQNWSKGFDEKGRPQQIPGSNSSPEGSFLVYPTLGGATNFQPPSYSPLTGWFYLAYSEAGQQFSSAPAPITRGQMYTGRGRVGPPPARSADQPAPNAGIKALDPETGKSMWDFKIFQGSITNGVLATGGGVLFVSTRDGNLSALDAKTGTRLWYFQTGGNHAAAPMTYAIDGKQYVALSSGNVVFSFALPE